ncbi:MAG: hypothetical protein AAF626_06635 [Pseudomonadota bacterium]
MPEQSSDRKLVMGFWLPASEKNAHERMKALSDFVAGLIRIAILGALTDATMTRSYTLLSAAQGAYALPFAYELFGLLILTLVFGGLLVALAYHLIMNAHLHASAWAQRHLRLNGAPRWLRRIASYFGIVVFIPPLLIFVFSGGEFISEFLGWDPVEPPAAQDP